MTDHLDFSFHIRIIIIKIENLQNIHLQYPMTFKKAKNPRLHTLNNRRKRIGDERNRC